MFGYLKSPRAPRSHAESVADFLDEAHRLVDIEVAEWPARSAAAIATIEAGAPRYTVRFGRDGFWRVLRVEGRMFDSPPSHLPPAVAEWMKDYEREEYLERHGAAKLPAAYLHEEPIGPLWPTQEDARAWLAQHVEIELGNRRRSFDFDAEGREFEPKDEELVAAEAVMV